MKQAVRAVPLGQSRPAAAAPRRSPQRLDLAAAAAALLLTACSRPGDQAAPPAAGEPSAAVRQAHAEAARRLAAIESRSTAEADARRGFVAAPRGRVLDAQGRVIWDFDAFAFVEGAAPATVHPGLWRQARLNNQAGLFKVVDGVWQLRGFDLSHITLIEGRSGWIVVDALTSREAAAAAMAFARQHLGPRPVSALIYTHSHMDAFGGALGVVTAEEARERALPVIAPQGFIEEATSENLLAGTAMGRRAAYMYGSRLPPGPAGLVDNGLGKAVALGQAGLVPPNRIVSEPRQEMTVDGVPMVFFNVPGAEAPAELMLWLPQQRAFGSADMMVHTLHNLYTLRGTKVRDPLLWARYLDESLAVAGQAEVVFNQHTWPVWGREAIREFIVKQRDAYRYIHDQTVRLMNAGRTAPEIAETLTLPPALDEHLGVRGHYGTVRHNAKGVVQFYLGWFDAHPANLDPLPPVEAGRRYVALAGGPAALLAAARKAHDAADYRWSAELLKHLVYAEPSNAEARELLARSFEQMGYLAESAPWRNFYLTGALELRQGPPRQGVARETVLDVLRHAPTERLLGAMAAALDGPRAAEAALKINLVFTDRGESHVLWIENAVLHHRRAPPADDADATLTVTHALFVQMLVGRAGAKELLLSPEARIGGSALALGRFFGLLEMAPGNFPIVTR
ncbi:MAG: alkyl/aryl-sulfatase [Betaproteobacteria bacterium]